MVKDNIIIKSLKADGSQKDMPAIDPKMAKNVDIRLNVTGANGYKKAFLIKNYETVKADYGPVLDMFAGTTTLKPGDFSFMFEYTEAKGDEILEGEVPYTFEDGWIVVECSLSEDKRGKFIVDFGSTTTFIPKSMLPKETEIETFKIVEYSAEGIKESDAVTQGATGIVDNIAGNAILDEFKLGDISINDFKIQVLNEFPKPFLERNVNGVLGRDVLMKTDIVEFLNMKKEAEKKIVFSKKDESFTESKINIPFNLAGGGNIYIDGKIQNIPQHFFFDSGSVSNSIPKQFLENHNIEYKIISDQKKIVYGIDGKGFEIETIELQDISINTLIIDRITFDMQSVFALEKTSSGQETALLGMEFFKPYNNVIFDFESNAINLEK